MSLPPGAPVPHLAAGAQRCEPIDPPDARVIGVYNPLPAKPSRAQTSQIMLTRLGGAGRFILPGPICNYVLVTVM